MMVEPRWPATSFLLRDGGLNPCSAEAMAGASKSNCSATAAAASALETLCWPGTLRKTSASPRGVRIRKLLPSRPWRRIRSARTVASSATP